MAGEKPVMVFGIDDSEHSYYALEWTLSHFFTPNMSTPNFKLYIIHAKPSPTSVIGLAGPGIHFFYLSVTLLFFILIIIWFQLFWLNFVGVIDVMPSIDSDLKKIAARVIEKAKEICTAKSVCFFFEIWTLIVIWLKSKFCYLSHTSICYCATEVWFRFCYWYKLFVEKKWCMLSKNHQAFLEYLY